MSGIHILKGHRVHLQTVPYLVGSEDPVKVCINNIEAVLQEDLSSSKTESA